MVFVMRGDFNSWVSLEDDVTKQGLEVQILLQADQSGHLLPWAQS